MGKKVRVEREKDSKVRGVEGVKRCNVSKGNPNRYRIKFLSLEQ